MDFFINPPYGSDSLPHDTFKVYRSVIDKYFKVVYNSTKLNRIGVIFTLFELEQENVSKVFETFLVEKYLSGNNEVSIRTNCQKLNKGIIYNNVRTIEAAQIDVDGCKQRGIIIQFDTNNAPLENDTLTVDNMSDIVEFAISNIKTKAIKELI